jgi:hypothetical protein
MFIWEKKGEYFNFSLDLFSWPKSLGAFTFCTAKYCTYWQTKAASGFLTSMQAFERNLVSSRQCCPQEAAIMHQKLADPHFEVLKHQACSPDLAPLNYYLFPNHKKHLRGRKFLSTEEATSAMERQFETQS